MTHITEGNFCAGKPTDQSDSISPVLRDATVDTITNLACALEFPFNINKNNICISGKNGVSTCNVRLPDKLGHLEPEKYFYSSKES